jgi:putative flippase GtrA
MPGTDHVAWRSMEPTAHRSPNWLDRRLERLQLRRAIGLPIRFYLRRREQVMYLAIGGWNTVFGYSVWALLQLLLGEHLHYLVVVLIAWPIAVLNAYLGYRYLVFNSRGSILRELPRFSLVYLTTLVINLVLLPIALRVLPFNIYVIQALLTVVVVVGSYLGHKHFSFGGGRAAESLAAARKD